MYAIRVHFQLAVYCHLLCSWTTVWLRSFLVIIVYLILVFTTNSGTQIWPLTILVFLHLPLVMLNLSSHANLAWLTIAPNLFSHFKFYILPLNILCALRNREQRWSARKRFIIVSCFMCNMNWQINRY